MKTVKKTTAKKVVKKVVKKPAFIIDYTEKYSPVSFKAEVALAKTRSNMPLSGEEIIDIAKFIVDSMMDNLFTWNNALMFTDNEGIVKLNLNTFEIDDTEKIIVTGKGVKVKKPNWFKRMVNKFRKK